MNYIKKHANRRGFSLVELVVVILIIAILAVAVFAGGSTAIKKSQVSRTTSDLHNFSIAIESAMNETPGIANVSKKSEFKDIVDAVNESLAADYHLSVASSITAGNILLYQSGEDGSYEIYKSVKEDAWGNPYYIVFDASERHNKGISEFYITVISAGPNAQTSISTVGGIESDDVFLLGQYTNGEVAAKIYNLSSDKIFSGGSGSTDTQRPLGAGKKGATVTNQGAYVGTVINGDGRNSYVPVNFQPTGVVSTISTNPSGVIKYTMLSVPAEKLPAGAIDGASGGVDGTKPAAFRSDAAKADFVEVRVDSVVVAPANYSITEGSTIVTFTKEYLSTLSDTTHTLEIISCNGSAITTFTKEHAGPVIINFTISGTAYQAEEGMTWSQWVGSSYNTGNFINKSGRINIKNTDKYVRIKSTGDSWSEVSANSTILANTAYGIVNYELPKIPL